MKHLQKDMWSRVTLTRVQTTTRPDHVWPEVWTKIGKAAQTREKQEWAKEKTKKSNARKTERIYFHDSDDREYSEFHKKSKRKNVKDLWLRRCREKDSEASWKRVQEPNFGNDEESKIVFDCIVESHGSTRQRAESFQSQNHEDHTAGKGITSIRIWCTSLCRFRKRWKFRMQKLPWTRNGRSSGGLYVDRYTCRTPHFHMYSHCTDHTAQMTFAHGSSLSCVPKMRHPSTRHVSPCALQHTEHQHKFSLAYLSCYCRPRLQTQTCCPRIHLSIVKIHGRIVLLRNSTPPQVMSPRRSNSTGFWSNHKIK